MTKRQYQHYDDYDPDSYFTSADRPSRGQQQRDDLPARPAPRAFKDLSEINMNSELASQIAEATSYRDYVLQNCEAFPTNHVTDTMKTCNTLLSQAVKLQATVQTMQRMKAFEDAVIETMQIVPDHIKEAFFALLEEKLK